MLTLSKLLRHLALAVGPVTLEELVEDLEEDEDDVEVLLDEGVEEGLINREGRLLHSATFEISRAGETVVEHLPIEKQRVFLVHGHDHGTLRSVESFINNAFKDELEPVILMDQPTRGSEGLYDKFDRYASDSDLALVLYTADDQANSVANPGVRELRPRPNVLVEIGYFFNGIGRERTWILRGAGATLPSDLLGSHWISLEGQWMYELQRDLRAYFDEC